MSDLRPAIDAIVEDAATLVERLAEQSAESGGRGSSTTDVEEWLQRWARALGDDGAEALERRLRWSGWTREHVRRQLSRRPARPVQPPDWATWLDRICGADPAPDALPQLPVDREDPLPFEDVLLPVICVARQELWRRVPGPRFPMLSERARHQLERGLLIDLTNLCAGALEHEFDQARPAGPQLLSLLVGPATAPPGREGYDRFVGALLEDGLLGFFARWPVLARLLAQLVEMWVEAVAELLGRLEEDLPEIARRTGPGDTAAGLGRVAAIRTHLSDRHHGGRTVLALEFESGRAAVYKPRAVALEAAFFSLLSWCNARPGLAHRFRVLWVLDRGTHGWMELVEPESCADAAAATRFYERAGFLLALLYALRGTDCHHDNIISAGEHPVLVDAEALLHPDMDLRAMGEEPGTGAQPIDDPFRHSVLRTGLLPRWEFSGRTGVALDVSALGAAPAEHERRAGWLDVNRDSMRRALVALPRATAVHVPLLNGRGLSANDHLPAIISGFAAMYRFLMHHRAALASPGGPLERFQNAGPRFIFRVTQTYDAILERSISLPHLRSGISRSIELERLARAFLLRDRCPPAWPVLAAEQAALARLDIPYFCGAAAGSALQCCDGTLVPGFFEAPVDAEVRRQLEVLDEADLAAQLDYIKGAFQAKIARSPARAQESDRLRSASATELDRQEPLEPGELLAEAEAIGLDLVRRAVRSADGSANWIGLVQEARLERYQLQPLGVRLYDGSSGIALFLAALERTVGSGQFGELALAAVAPLRRHVRTAGPRALARWGRDVGPGGAVGLGSIVYALVRIGDFLARAELVEDAEALAGLISDAMIDRDSQLDVVGGAAGAILGLLALHARTGDERVLARARRCGRTLLARRTSRDGGPRAWRTIEPEPLTGFAHGAGGIAYALARLHGATGDGDFRDGALEAIAYERSRFDARLGNWPDLRRSGRADTMPWFMVNWCHGASGIGLARLGTLPLVDTPELRDDIETALETTRAWGGQDVDHLCCGNAGRVELFLAAAETLARIEPRERALRHAGWMVGRARRAGGYRLFPDFADDVRSPGLFQGTAGIGYELLRLVHGRGLPSLLLWQ